MKQAGINTDSAIPKIEGEKSRCVAWFKLADLVSRKEKEKALNLYRLLSHSLEERAYALQVEGDILWSLEDNAAIEKYLQAAYLYKKEKKLTSSIAIYEHLLTLEPHNFSHLKTLALLYLFLSWPEKFEQRYEQLLLLLDSGVVEFGKVWDFTKQLIDLFVIPVKLNQPQIEKEFEIKVEELSENKWLLASLYLVLKNSHSSLYDLFEKYCLDNQLNFNS